MKDEALQVLSGREWILTNGIGGYALGFGNMMMKRKYNGLLIASLQGFKRISILSSVEEKLEDLDGEIYLDSNHYPNCIYPDGTKYLAKAWLRPYPAALYTSPGSNINFLILKEIFLAQGRNAVVIRYTNLGKKDVSIAIRPKFSLRDHHVVNQSGTWNHTGLDCDAKDDSFAIKRHGSGIQAFGYTNAGKFSCERIVFGNVYYPVEMLRGYDSTEDLISPVCLRAKISPDKPLTFVVSAEPVDDPVALAEAAEKHYRAFPLPVDHPHNHHDSSHALTPHAGDLFSREDYMKILEVAARDFVVCDSDVIAGYPWFGAWGRDSMISLGGVACLSDGLRIAKAVLHKYGAQIRGGLMPNTFGEGGEGLNYDTVDAPLWFVLRCREIMPKDEGLFEKASCVVLNYMFQQDLPFFMADDGLIEVRHGNYALTWMDAKIYGNPVTPRFGKPIEINGLWYNALRSIEDMAKLQGKTKVVCGDLQISVDEIKKLADKVSESMKVFIGPQYLADRIENGEPVWEIRPNAVTAVSLPYDFTTKEVMKRVWKMARDALLTSYGLRTLDPLHPAYKQKYIGSQKQRDLAYHQGTVWPYLLQGFAKLSAKVLSAEYSRVELEKEIGGYIWTFRDAFMRGEFSSVAEVWDGSDPYFPKGCPAQAWSVFALLEIENMLRS